MKRKRTTFSPMGLITGLVSAYFNKWLDLGHLLRLESKLAVKSLIHVVMLACIALLLLLVTWLSLLMLLFFYLSALSISPLSIALIITVINLICLLISVYVIYKKKDNLNFKHTRKQLALLSFRDDDDDD